MDEPRGKGWRRPDTNYYEISNAARPGSRLSAQPSDLAGRASWVLARRRIRSFPGGGGGTLRMLIRT